MNLNDAILNQLRLKKIPVKLFFTVGDCMEGTIAGFDPNVILLEQPGQGQIMIYKHALSSIIPEESVPIFGRELGEESQ